MFLLQNHFLTVKPIDMMCKSHERPIETEIREFEPLWPKHFMMS